MINNENHQDNIAATAGSYSSYKESIRRMIFQIVGNAFEEDMQDVSSKLHEEREKAVGLLVEENRVAIKDMVEEGKKLIQARAHVAPTTGTFQTEYIDEVIMHIYQLIGSVDTGSNGNDIGDEIPEIVTQNTDVKTTVWTELEILPPRDQDEIETIGLYMNTVPGIISLELKTMMEKSIYKVESEEPIDFVKKLQTLPQILAIEKVQENGLEKFQITLNTRSKLAKTQDEMDAKVKKIFHNKK